MPQGRYPTEYFAQPQVDKPLDQIYADLDAYSMEYFEDEPAFHERIDLWVLLPPLLYEGQFLKGICFSQGLDYLYKLYPQLPHLFFTIANSQWCSYPWSRHADAYFTLYPHAVREQRFRRTHPDRGGKILIPLQDADFTHEYTMAPVPFVPKEYDVICVSRMQDLKNLPMIAAALKVYRQKYQPIRTVLITGKAFDANFQGLDARELAELRQMETILEHPRDYIEFVPQARYGAELAGYYSRSKLCVLGSLLEGKNRTLFEALSCNTPVVCFRQFNQYARGGGLETARRGSLDPAETATARRGSLDPAETDDRRPPGGVADFAGHAAVGSPTPYQDKEAALHRGGGASAAARSEAEPRNECVEAPAFPDRAGLYAPDFDAESLADTFHQVLQNETSFHPRRRFLETSGRKNFLNRCLDSFPYYENALPDYARGQHVGNLWLDLAVQANYQLSLIDFLYARNHRISHVRGLKAIDDMLRFYFGRFGLG